MALMFLVGVFVTYHFEQKGNPILERLGIQTAVTDTQAGGNMEGKEVRFGIPASALFATVTTDASCGAINSWHDSFTPLAGLVTIFNIMTGEVIFGGVGSGLYGILLYAIVAVFIAGPDGGQNAGVYRQEDRTERSQDGDARADRHCG